MPVPSSPRSHASAKWRGLLALLTIFLISACSDDDEPSPMEPPTGSVPDFSVPDVNDTSLRFGEDVSPRDYVGSVSAWYFGHAT